MTEDQPRSAILQMDAGHVAELLGLPKEARIVAVETPFHLKDVISFRLEGVGYFVPTWNELYRYSLDIDDGEYPDWWPKGAESEADAETPPVPDA